MSSGLRRSERIFILESKKAQQAVDKKKRDMSLVSTEGQSSQRQRRKKSKGNNTSNNKVTNSVGESTVSTETLLPETSSLHLLLQILKRRDKHKIFAEPVNAAEVIGYNNVVKEPMDFATISTKLSEGKYKWLEQFEHDIFLVFSNAMLFNASNTIYYRQARAIREVAKKLLTALRADTNMFEIKFALAKFSDTWTKADARLINSIASNKSKELATAGKGATDPEKSEGLLQTENSYNLWTSYRSDENEAPVMENVFGGTDSGSLAWGYLSYGQTISRRDSVPEFDGGLGSVAQPMIDESNYGALTLWQTPTPPLPLHVGEHQQVPNMVNQSMFEQPDHRALSLWQAPAPPRPQVPDMITQPIPENPDQRALALWQPSSHQRSNMVARPNFERNNLGASSPWQSSSHHHLGVGTQHQIPVMVAQPILNRSDYGALSLCEAPPNPQVQVPGQQEMASATYPGSGVDANPSGDNAAVPDQNANAASANPAEDPSVSQGDNIIAEIEHMSMDELVHYIVEMKLPGDD